MLKRSKFEKTFRDVRHAKCQITWIRSKMAAHVAAKVKHMAAHAHTNLATATTITNNLQHDHHTCRHMAAWNGPKRHAFGAGLCIKRQQWALFHNANANLCLHCKVTRGWPAKMSHIHQTHTLCRHMAAPTHHCRHNNVQKIKRRKCSISLGHTMVLCRHMAAPQGMCMLIHNCASSPPVPPNGPLCLHFDVKPLAGVTFTFRAFHAKSPRCPLRNSAMQLTSRGSHGRLLVAGAPKPPVLKKKAICIIAWENPSQKPSQKLLQIDNDHFDTQTEPQTCMCGTHAKNRPK